MAYGNRGGFSSRRGPQDRRGGDRSRFGGRDGGYKSGFDRGGRGGRDSRGPKQMFDAVCGSCGDDCQVPFRPTGDKPVLCSNCFDKSGGRERSFDRDRAPRGDRPFKKEFSAPKPDPRIGELQEEVASLHEKIDTLISLMSEPTKKKAKKVVEAVPEEDVLFDEPAPAKKPKRIIPSKEDAVKGLMKAKKKETKKATKKKTK